MDARKLTREQIIRALRDPGYWDSLCAAERAQSPVPAPDQPRDLVEVQEAEIDRAADDLRPGRAVGE